jgi:hypothetical protein
VAVSFERFDLDAIRAGGMVAVVFAIPITVIASLVDSDSGATNALFFVGAMVGFFLGAGCAAWVQRLGSPLTHGITTALLTFVVPQLIIVIVRLAGGNSVNLFNVFLLSPFVVGTGLFGGLAGGFLRSRGFVPSGVKREP